MAERVRLSAGALELELAPEVGGSVAAFRMNGAPVFRESPADLHDAGDSGCFPLVPFSNRVRDGVFSFRGREVRLAPNLPPQKHPLHGQGWRGAWTVEAVHTDAQSADGLPLQAATLVFDHAPGEWPWAYQARQTFELDPEGLSVWLECRNLSSEPMPCGLGFHPYFPADAHTVLHANVADVWTVDDEVMPTGREPAQGRYDLQERHINGAGLDNGFGWWDGEAWLRQAQHTVRIEGSGRGDLHVSHLQVYAPPQGGVVVVEPVSHANGVLNLDEPDWRPNGLRVLEPGEQLVLEARFDVISGGDGA